MFFVELIPRKRKEKRRMKAKKEREINNSSPSIFFFFPPQTTPPLPLILAFLFNIHLASLSLPTRKKGRRRRGMLGAFSFSRVCAKLPILRLIVPKIVLPNRVYERRIKIVAPGTSVCRTKKNTPCKNNCARASAKSTVAVFVVVFWQQSLKDLLPEDV